MADQQKVKRRVGRYFVVLVIAVIAALSLVWVSQSDDSREDADASDYLPIVKVAPLYPEEAVARGLTGHCDLEFTVTTQGTTTGVKVIECTNQLFEEPSIQAMLGFRYKPRMVDGAPVEVSGVRNRFSYTISG